MQRKLRRVQVYQLIEGERDYQDKKWGTTLSSNKLGSPEEGGNRSVDEFILYIAGYTNDAVNVASHFGDIDKKLDVVRKIAGLCVACMEQHGAPPRGA